MKTTLFIVLLALTTTLQAQVLQFEGGVIMKNFNTDSLKADSFFTYCGGFNVSDTTVHYWDDKHSINYTVDEKILETKCKCFYYTVSFIEEIRVLRINLEQQTLSMGGYYNDKFLVYIYFLKAPNGTKN